jgi:hypothetical protein
LHPATQGRICGLESRRHDEAPCFA